jgi:hypothetical protein
MDFDLDRMVVGDITFSRKGAIARIQEEDNTYSIVYIYPTGDFSEQDYVAKKLLKIKSLRLSLKLVDYLHYELPELGINYVRELKRRLEEIAQ